MLHELTLRGLVLANPPVPYVLVKQTEKGLLLTDSLLIVLSIIPLELLGIWLVFKFDRIAINFYRLLIAVLLANIATSIIGIPYLYINYSVSSYFNPDSLGMFLTFNFLISWLVESLIYRSFLKQENLSLVNIVKAAFASNLLSYLMFAFVLLPHTNFSRHSISSFDLDLDFINSYLTDQQYFHTKNNHFYSNMTDSPAGIIRKRNDYRYDYRYEIQSNKTSATIAATAKQKHRLSFRGTIFFCGSKDSYIQNICITDRPSTIPPEMPKLVNGTLLCPPGSSDVTTFIKQ